MTSLERVAALVSALEYIVGNGIPGDVVECGVWRGGSIMAAAKTLIRLGDTSRTLHLFDTFEGMSAPTGRDVDHKGVAADALLRRDTDRTGNVWARATLDDVKQNLWSTGYPRERIMFVAGKVEETIPSRAPADIALLRLDTDWYSSTLHELEHLYPRLTSGGVLIIDDYGHWRGAREAVDEYMGRQRVRPLLNRIDYTGRMSVKP